MTDIVLAVPIGAASFQRAQEVVSEEVAARVREWPAVTQIVDSTAYIPLRTDWMPPRDRRTADGVELLLAGRWPGEVQQAIAAGQFARVSGRVVGEFWKAIQASAPAEKDRVQEFREYLKESLEVAMTEVLPEDWIQRVSNYPQPHEPGPWETPQGYRMMWDAEAQKIVFEHRYIYEKHHGAIPSGYVIHHINGIKNDNRIENLRMITPSEHIRLHAELRRLSREHNEVSEISPVNAGEKVTGAAAASALSVGRDPCKVARCDLNGEQSEAPPVAPECVADAHVLPQNPVADHKAPDSAVEEIYPEGEMDQDVPAARILNIPAETIEPIFPDEVIDRLTLDAGGLDDLTRTIKTLEHYGAKFPPWFCDQPIEAVRAGLKDAARSERVLRAYAAEQDGIRRQRDALVAQWAIDVGVSLPDPEPAIGLEFPCTDDGNGDRLVAQYRDSIRYCATFDAWYIWNGSFWERDETCRMLALAKRVARTIHLEASATTDDRREKVGKWALSSGMLSRLKAMIACAAPAVAVTPDEFDARPELLNCRNGTLELDTLTFREARREDLLTKQAGVAYDPEAACPTWLAHLDLVFGGDAAYIRGFQELCGYSLLQYNPEQIMAILYGTGKNGKSVTIGALARVWGDYAVNIAAESLMVRRNDGPRSDLARLHGARLVTASEGESRAYLAESVVKQITGDDAITVRRLYENEFQFRPGAKIFLATNHEPRIRGTDEGIWRRLWLLPFTVTIPEGARDPMILERLEAEGSGILNWCLEGLRRYQENGCRLAPPEKVLAATARFRSESDMVGRFLAQEMKVEPTGTIERTALYKIYLKWCEDEGERPVSNRAVIKYLRERGFGERKLGGVMCWTGIRIKSATEAEEDATEGSLQAGL